MRTVATHILISLLISTYSVGIIGISIYKGPCEHDGQITLFNECDCNHKAGIYCCYHCGQPVKKGCCSTEYQVLELDQETSDNVFSFKNYDLAKILFAPAILFKISAADIFPFRYCDPPPLEHSPTTDIHCLAQLRL